MLEHSAERTIQGELPDSLLPSLENVTEFKIKALSRKAVLDSSEKFQLTASTKSSDSVLWQLQALQCGLVYCLRVVLLGLLGFLGSRIQVWPVKLLW